MFNPANRAAFTLQEVLQRLAFPKPEACEVVEAQERAQGRQP
jgi:hypothetical protein